jgi:hypothetical protein
VGLCGFVVLFFGGRFLFLVSVPNRALPRSYKSAGERAAD